MKQQIRIAVYKYARQIYKIIVHVQYRYNYEKDIYEYLKYDIIKRLCFEKGGTLNV